MTAIADLQAAWETEIATIGDTLQKAQATYLLERYIAAVAKQAALESNEIQSYTIAGRSFTRRDVTAGQATIQVMENELVALVYGTVSQIDMNNTVSQPSGTSI